MLPRFVGPFFVCFAGFLSTLHPQETKPDTQPIANGWRGNGTGLWPDARPPSEWYRIPKGILNNLATRVDRPKERHKENDGLPLAKGIVREWLVLGPIPVQDSVKDFDKAQLADEAGLRPTTGDKVGDLVWKKLTAKLDNRWAFGVANLPWTDVGAAVGGVKPNQMAYAHTYLYSPRAGTIRAIVDHMFGLKVWLNGKEVYADSQRRVHMGTYYAYSRTEFGTDNVAPSPRFELALKPGWNRLLLKISSFNRQDASWNQQNFCLRLMDLPNVPYESKNILWMAELPQRSNATPIVVGKYIFVMAEPDELLCLDKDTGKILWRAANNYYEALTTAERETNPAFAKKVDPLVHQIRKEADFRKRLELRTQLQKTLTEIDPERFGWKADGHFEAHFGIVGFTTPTPCSDGRHVWAWCGNGIAACYDLDGKRRWITRVEDSDLTYSSSPALADGTLAVFLHRLVGLDAKTGKVRWEQKKVNQNTGAILAGRIAGVPVFVTSMGDVVRARDGKMLFRERDRAGGGSSWAPPVILGDRVVLPRYGAHHLLILNFSGQSGEEWKPTRLALEAGVRLRTPSGAEIDRPTPGSPLVVGDIAYTLDIYSTLYAFDAKAKKLAFHHNTELDGWFHYNAVPVAASPTLIGKHIIIQDNQGLALVLEPGPVFRQVGKNRIATQLDRWWPVPAQETIAYSPPVPDGNRLFIRGERYLYCIGEPAEKGP